MLRRLLLKLRIRRMTFEELDNYIDELPYNWMKPLRLEYIRKIRPEYSYNHVKKISK